MEGDAGSTEGRALAAVCFPGTKLRLHLVFIICVLSRRPSSLIPEGPVRDTARSLGRLRRPQDGHSNSLLRFAAGKKIITTKKRTTSPAFDLDWIPLSMYNTYRFSNFLCFVMNKERGWGNSACMGFLLDWFSRLLPLALRLAVCRYEIGGRDYSGLVFFFCSDD